VDPGSITLTIEKRTARMLPVQLEQNGDVARGYEAGAVTLTPYTTTVSGPASLVDNVSEIRALISLAGLKDNFNDTVSLTPVDSAGKVVAGVELRPPTIHVQVLITQKQGFRDVTVSPVITGQVASGYRLTNITVSPAVVTVSSSDPLKVDKLPGFIETQPLDITGWNSDRAVRLPLTLPPGISLEGDQAVFVQVSIAPIEYSLTVTRPLELQGLADGLEATASPEKVDLLISGPLPILNKLQEGDVRIFLDLRDLDVGTYQVTPQVNLLPSELRVDKILTSPVEVTIKIKPTETPTPTPTETVTPTITPTPTKTKKP
jgi:YbbR domain-containing protein